MMTAELPVWRDFTRDALDIAYNNTAACPHAAESLAALSTQSEATRARFCTARNIAYGPGERQRYDLLACGKPDAPLLVFIHGGYWIRNHKDMFTAMAEGPLASGFDVGMIGYTLAPDAGLTEIIAECEMAVRALRLATAASRLIASGWSAGGHLAARLAEMEEVDAALPISGIFDLEPIRLGVLNDKLRLSREEAIAQSPIKRLEQAAKPIIVAYGTAELPELQRQSVDYAAARRAAGLAGAVLPLAGRDHFTILAEMTNPEGALTQVLRKMA
jgi:arylformamidase